MTTENQSPASTNDDNNFNKAASIGSVRSVRNQSDKDKVSMQFKTLSLRPTKSIKKKSSFRPTKNVK